MLSATLISPGELLQAKIFSAKEEEEIAYSGREGAGYVEGLKGGAGNVNGGWERRGTWMETGRGDGKRERKKEEEKREKRGGKQRYPWEEKVMCRGRGMRMLGGICTVKRRG